MKKKFDDKLFLVIIAFGYPLVPSIIIFSIFDILYLGTGSPTCLILAILTVLVYLGIALYIIVGCLKKDAPSNLNGAPAGNSDLTSNEEAAFSAGVIGGVLLDRALRKDHSSGKSENDFLWQEKIRRDMFEDGFIDW